MSEHPDNSGAPGNLSVGPLSPEKAPVVITLLSDLGTRDAAVSIAKAILSRHLPSAAVIDISHGVASYDLQQAAYLLLSAYPHFPAGTIHILPVDVFSGTAPCMLLAEKEGSFFIAPDNGLLPLAFGTGMENTRLCFEFSKPFIFSDWVNSAGLVAKAVHSGGPLPFGLCEVKKAPRMQQPKLMPDGVECSILFIDRYENIALDITMRQFDELVQGRPFKIKLSRTLEITTVSKNYNDVPMGAPLCRFNNAGFLEIALNHDRAATLLGLHTHHGGMLRYQAVKILFSV